MLFKCAIACYHKIPVKYMCDQNFAYLNTCICGNEQRYHTLITSVVTSHKRNACSEVCLIFIWLHDYHGQLNIKDTDMEKTLVSCDITSEVI